MSSRGSRRNRLRGKLARTTTSLALVVVLLAGCEAAFDAPADTGAIEKVSEETIDGWRYEFFRNLAYPCSLEGHQTFVIRTPVGDDAAVERPLWVRMRGGGSGWFVPGDGDPKDRAEPDDDNMREEPASGMRNRLRNDALGTRVAQAVGARGLAVSMCNRDTYGGANNLDPNNVDLGGVQRTTNGLLATKAAIQFTMARHATSDFFLHGGSAGSVGTYHVSHSLQEQGLAPAGIVADGGIRNDAWEAARIAQNTCNSRYGSPEWAAAFSPRVHSRLRGPEAQPHELVTSGELRVPIVQVWSHGDQTSCGAKPMVCPVPGEPTMGATDCKNEPLRAAIAAQGPTSRSMSLGVCVTSANPVEPCDVHVSTPSELPNTDPALPADYLALIVDWVEERLAEPVEHVVGAELSCPWDPADTRRHTFLVAGDHDAVAVGANAAALPPVLAAGDPRLFTFVGGTWQPVTPAGAASFGPELSFAATLLAACPSSQIGLVKHTDAGSTMAGWAPGGAPWAAMSSRTAGALTSGVPLVLEGAIVHQGVLDGQDLGAATSWTDHFVATVDGLRAAAAVPDDLPVFVVTERRGAFPFDVSGIDPDDVTGILWDGPYRGHVLAAQWAAGSARPGVHLVEVRDAALVPGTERHTTRGVRAVGRALAVAYVTAVD